MRALAVVMGIVLIAPALAAAEGIRTRVGVRVPLGTRPTGGRWGPPVETRQDRDIPDTLLMAPFPSNDWRPTHADYFRFVIDDDRQHAKYPRFWEAIQRELEEAVRRW